MTFPASCGCRVRIDAARKVSQQRDHSQCAQVEGPFGNQRGLAAADGSWTAKNRASKWTFEPSGRSFGGTRLSSSSPIVEAMTEEIEGAHRGPSAVRRMAVWPHGTRRVADAAVL